MESGKSPASAKAYLREWREHLDLTQEQLAARMQTTGATISKKEANPDTVSVAWLRRFASALGVTLDQLFRDPTKPTPSDRLRDMIAHVPEARAEDAIELLQILAKKRAS